MDNLVEQMLCSRQTKLLRLEAFTVHFIYEIFPPAS